MQCDLKLAVPDVKSNLRIMMWICTSVKFLASSVLYRNLIKPIAVQSKEKEDRYVDNYRVRRCGACLDTFSSAAAGKT